MVPQLDKAIEEAIAKGVPAENIAQVLISSGWPPSLVHESVNAWLSAHGRLQSKTGFKEWLAKYRGKALAAIAVITAVGFVTSLITLLKPWPVKIMVDSAFGNIPAPGPLEPYTHTPELILFTSALTLVIFIAGSIFGAFKDYLGLRLGFWLDRQVKEESLRHILHLPLFHKERLAKGDYLYRQNTLTNSLSDLVLDTTTSIIQSVILIIGILLIMLSFNVRLTLISMVLIPFLYILIRIFGPSLGKISWALTRVSSKVSSTVAESIDNSETVQSYNLQEKQVARVNNLWRQDYKLTMKSLLIGRGYRFSNGLLVIAATSAVMYFGGTAALNGDMTLGQLLIFMTYMGYLLGPVESLAIDIASRNQKLVDVSRVYEVLNDHEGIETLRRGHHLPLRKGRVEFQNVYYSYSGGDVLNGINLTVEAGRKIGLVGPSGAGKSTLLKMLPLFVEPQRGRILVDGIDIQTVSQDELRSQIAWISQSPQLFSGSLYQNLIDANVFRQVSQDEAAQAVIAANVSEFLDKLPEGVQSEVGEGGNNLSGGQRQRVAVARALIKNAPIICMDEPTAALDAESEKHIKEAMPRLIAGKTVLLVTHRQPLLEMMDEIYIMENGRLKKLDEDHQLSSYIAEVVGAEAKKVQSAKQSAEEARKLETKRLLKEEQKLAELRAENQRLQKKLQLDSRRNEAEEGVIYISH